MKDLLHAQQFLLEQVLKSCLSSPVPSKKLAMRLYSKSDVLSAAIVQALLVGDETQALKYASFLPDMFSAVYFLLPREKNQL